jgi:hypothetical protein
LLVQHAGSGDKTGGDQHSDRCTSGARSGPAQADPAEHSSACLAAADLPACLLLSCRTSGAGAIRRWPM